MTSRLRFLAAVSALLLSLPQAALARETGPTWHSETTGLPVSTMQGQWTESDGGRSAELSFFGGHLIQPWTTFKATWLSPFTSKGERASFEDEYELENENNFGKSIDTKMSFRFRNKGELWTQWWTFAYKLKPGRNFLGGATMFFTDQKGQMQFEWRMTGKIKAPTYLRGSATFKVN